MFKRFLHIFYPDTYTLSNGKVVKEKFKWTPYIVIAVSLLVIFCCVITKVDFHKFIVRFNKGFTFVVRMFNPDWAYWKTLKNAMIDTIVISVVGTAFGMILALPLSFFLANNFKLNKIYLATHRGILSLFRTLPTLIYAQLLALIIGFGSTAGVIATAIFTYTVAVKMLYEQIETVDMGPYEALESTGASKLKCMFKAVYPQVNGYFWSTVLYCFEMNVRSSAILGYVGAGGIGQNLNAVLGNMKYERAGLIVFVMIIVVVIIETITRELRKKLVAGE